MGDLLYLLLLLVLLLLALLFLDLGLVFLLLAIFLLLLVILVVGLGDFLILGLFDEELNGETDELRVLLNEVLEAALLEELKLVLLHVKDDLGAASNALTLVLVDGEGTAGIGLPSVLLVVIALGDDSDSLSN